MLDDYTAAAFVGMILTTLTKIEHRRVGQCLARKYNAEGILSVE